MFLAVNMGGSGTAPSFAAAYGANLIRKDLIPGLFGIMVFAGAIFSGGKVSVTLGSGILHPEYMSSVLVSIMLFSVAMSLLFANLVGIPQSTSQSTVAALAAPAAYLNQLNTHKLFYQIIPTWFILPIIGFFITYFSVKYFYRHFKEKFPERFEEVSSHPVLKQAVIISACYVAYSIGANNVGNAAGPVAFMSIHELGISPSPTQMRLILIVSILLVAPCFGIGSSLLGYKLVQNTGKEIIEIGPMGATIISIVTATLLLLASIIGGIPTSLVQLNIAAILAYSVVKVGWRKALKDKMLAKIWITWLMAPVFSFLLALGLTYCADKLGILSL
jgi:sulfate permease